MAEERKTTPHEEGLRDCASDLRRFARALAGAAGSQIGDAMAQTVLGRLAESGVEIGRERAFAELVRLNRRRVREVREAEHAHDAGRREGGLPNQIEVLPLDEREALLAIALGGFSYDAAAVVLEVPRSSVVSRLMRARARLDGARSGATQRPNHLRVVK